MSKFITIRTCATAIDAEIIKSKLEAEGIHCFIDEGAARGNPLLTNAVGWIKINVPEDDAQRAFELIGKD